MSSSRKTPFEDITNKQNQDPKEVKRQRDREWYAKNKDEISKRRRQLRELKKQSTTDENDETQAIGQSGVTQIQYRSTEKGAAPDVQHYASQNREPHSSLIHGSISLVDTDDGSEWLHRNDAYNMQAIPGRSGSLIQLSGVDDNVGCNNVLHEPMVASSSQSAMCGHVTDPINNRASTSQNRPHRIGQSWYARLSEEKKYDYLQRQRISRQQKKAAARSVLEASQPTPASVPISPHTPMSNVTNRHTNPHQTPGCESAMGQVSASADFHGQDSFLAKNADPDKRRNHRREMYSLMTDEHREEVLRKNREYKKCRLETTNGCASTPVTTPAMHAQSCKHNQPGDTNRDDEYDPTGVFEPVTQDAALEDNLETIQDEQTMHDDDEESRIFSGQGDVFDSWRVTSGVAPSNQTQPDDPYDFVYHNLPKKHHVLKPVEDCQWCGAMKLQYEGPAFCCRKGKFKVVTPEVPQELRRLFTSQVDEDAKYFRKHIRYFNTHFSFTSLGVTLDKNVSNAAGTGVYTFRAQGALYHKMDDLVPGGQGPRHLQLYIYDTDETLEHRVKRSPDLDINIIRLILKILEKNPYVQIFKSIGSVPNLAEYRISLNTDIRLDQRRYNAPTTSQVAAMWVEGSDPQNTFDRQVVVYGKGDRPIFIRAYYGCYDPLAYPLFFPRGEAGWNRWMPYHVPSSAVPSSVVQENDDGAEDEDLQFQDRTADANEEQNEDEAEDDEEGHEDDDNGGSRKYVSAREYYCFKLQVRKHLFNIILFGARELQQWAVDMYIKTETMRLDFYSKPKNQKLIRADLYQLHEFRDPVQI